MTTKRRLRLCYIVAALALILGGLCGISFFNAINPPEHKFGPVVVTHIAP